MEVVSLSKGKKKVLKSEMCFVFCQMYRYVSGQVGMRISKEEKRTSESSSPLSTRARTVKHLKIKFPLGK